MRGIIQCVSYVAPVLCVVSLGMSLCYESHMCCYHARDHTMCCHHARDRMMCCHHARNRTMCWLCGLYSMCYQPWHESLL